LHGGFGFDSRSWRRQLDALSDAFTVVAWDMPGCGRSSDPPETFGAFDFADCLTAFIPVLGLERPHLLGLSFGSALALELYRWHPSILRTRGPGQFRSSDTEHSRRTLVNSADWVFSSDACQPSRANRS
jgi:pimeloyl-ACP methyl ester carboxylesterase